MSSTKVFVTIDTEWDRKKDREAVITLENLSQLSIFQKLCNKYSIKPIYFCTYEVLKNKQFINDFYEYVQKNNVEIGAHLHPWSNPPFPYGDPLEERKNASFPHEYPLEIFSKKLKVLTDLIQKKFNLSPVSYRAGRFGFIKEHIPYLSQLGYKIDSSITPHVSHANVKGWKMKGIDFSSYIDLNPKVLTHSNSSILEIPLTIIPQKHRAVKIFRREPSTKKTKGQSWFRIFPKTKLSDLLNIIEYIQKNNINTLVFMMHSNEFHPELNPYFTTLEDQKQLFHQLQTLFQKFDEFNVESITFRDYITRKH